MTTDCSLNYNFNTWKFQAQNMGRTCCVQKLFLTFRTIYVHNNMFSPCSAKIRASDKDLPVQVNLCQKFLFLQNMRRTCCVHKLFWMSKSISVHNMFSPCSELGIFTYWTGKSLNNLLSYHGLIDAIKRFTCNDMAVLNSQIECYSENVYCWNHKMTLRCYYS